MSDKEKIEYLLNYVYNLREFLKTDKWCLRNQYMRKAIIKENETIMKYIYKLITVEYHEQ